MRTRTLLLGAVTSVAMAGAANAGGWYVAGEAGANGIAQADVHGTFLGAPTTGTVSNDVGWVIMAAVGNSFAPRWRVEGELGFRHNDTSSNIAQIEELSLMVNVARDFELSSEFSLSLGVGVGIDDTKFNAGALSSDNDVNFAFQGLVGLNYAVSPNADITLTWRYFDVVDPSFQFGGAATLNFDDMANRSLTLGVRLRL